MRNFFGFDFLFRIASLNVSFFDYYMESSSVVTFKKVLLLFIVMVFISCGFHVHLTLVLIQEHLSYSPLGEIINDSTSIINTICEELIIKFIH